MRKLVIVRGGGDIATGTIYKLNKCGYMVLVLEIEKPSAIRRNVAVSEAVYDGRARVEDLECIRAENLSAAFDIMEQGIAALIVEEDVANILSEVISICRERNIRYTALVDAILAKKNLGTKKNMAPVTVALGPGFTAGKGEMSDVDAVIETMRGHKLGRIIYEGSAIPNTGTPGVIAGFSSERVIHSAAEGILENVSHVTDTVSKGQVIANIICRDGKRVPVCATLDGLLRGLIRDGYYVEKGFKIADIDPRISEYDNCFTISDKARCIAGGVVEAIMHLDKDI